MSRRRLELRKSLFDPQVGSEFGILIGERRLAPFELVESVDVSPAITRADPGRRGDAFSLLFKGEPTLSLEQRIHTLEHADLGSLELFLVPVGPGEYEAIIN